MPNTPSFNCVIVDDDLLAIEVLAKQLQTIDFLNLQASFSNPVEAIRFLELNPVDLVFLDVVMPHITGISLLKSLSIKPLVIFTTGYSNHAVEAFGLDAVDYLVKPFSFEKLIRAINKAMVILTGKSSSSFVDHTFVRSDGKYHKIFFDDVEYIEGMKDYVKVHFRRKVLIVGMNLSHIVEKFPKQIFSRVHKSYIVNKKKVSKLDNYEIMVGSVSIPIGAFYRENLHTEILSDKVTS